jgi:hypothetical protein
MQRDPTVIKSPQFREVKGTHVVWIVVIGIVVILAGIEIMGFRDIVPPRSHTNAAMKELKARLLEDAASRGAMVAGLADLSGYEPDAFPFVDGWQEPIGFAIEGDRVVLQSLGGDMEAGGLGQDLDMVGIFPLHGPDGAWSAPDVRWLIDPTVPGSAPVP